MGREVSEKSRREAMVLWNAITSASIKGVSQDEVIEMIADAIERAYQDGVSAAENWELLKRTGVLK